MMDFKKIYKLICIIQVPFFLQALRKGAAAGTEHLDILTALQCKFVVDIAANRGQFALIARKIFPDAIIHSVEPLNEPALIFQKVFEKDPKTFLHRCAVGTEKAIMKMHIAATDDSSSLLPIGQEQVRLFPKTGEHEIRDVQVLPLHEIIDEKKIHSPALLKLDVQGFELSVLEGCQSLLYNFEFVYVECSFVELYEGQALAYEVVAFLSESNFILDGIYNIYYDSKGKAIQADFFFTKKIND